MNAAPPSAADGPGKLHILVLDPLFRRTDSPGASRSFDLARQFVRGGHRVSILTTSAALNDETGSEDFSITVMPAGTRARLGYAMSPEIEGVFARGAFWRIWQFENVGAVFTTDRPLATLPLLMLFCTVRGIPLLLEARDGMPARTRASASFGQRAAAWFARAKFKLAARVARQIVTLSPDMQTALVAEGIRESKIHVSAPGCDTTLFASQPGSSAPALTAYPDLAQGMLVVAGGSMNAANDLAPLLDLAAAVQNHMDTAGGPLVNFALCGDGPARSKLEARAQELGLLNKSVWFLKPLPRREMAPLLSAATAAFVSNTSSSLFFDALAASRPVILAAPGWQRDLIEGRSAGLALPTNDTAAAARDLVDFLKDGDGLRRANQQAAALAAGRFNLDRVTSKVRSLIEESVAADPRLAVLRRRTLRAKRIFDFVASLSALIILSPALLALAIAIQIKMGGPVLFTQLRPGLKGKPFRVYKFRTMTNAKDASGALLPDGIRLTPFGIFLRRVSLDEVPQLLNVLKGDMSLVGPRPLLQEYMPYYTAEQHKRHDVLPGITGWAQVNGRNAITWEDKFAKDVWYVNNLSFWLDLKIIFKTIWIVVSGHGISTEGHATYQRFDEIMARRQGAEDV